MIFASVCGSAKTVSNKSKSKKTKKNRNINKYKEVQNWDEFEVAAMRQTASSLSNRPDCNYLTPKSSSVSSEYIPECDYDDEEFVHAGNDIRVKTPWHWVKGTIPMDKIQRMKWGDLNDLTDEEFGYFCQETVNTKRGTLTVTARFF